LTAPNGNKSISFDVEFFTMKWYLILLVCFLATAFISAQSVQYNSPAESDPEAKKLLNKLDRRMSSFKSAEIDFHLLIEYPGEDPITQNGILFQSGKKFRLEMEDYDILCDGILRWVYLKAENEVNIYSADSDQDKWTNPADFLKIYESEEFIYAITGMDLSEDGDMKLIEFKPTDPESELSKLRLGILVQGPQISSLKSFAKDGSRYTLTLQKFRKRDSLPDEYFVFDPKKFPGIHIEDLRID
jgi:outer membrane lipoprotein-sorting protein